MKKWWLVALLVAVAAGSAFNAFLPSIEHMFDPGWGRAQQRWQLIAMGAIAALMAAGVAAALRGWPARWGLGAVVLIVAAGFLPQIPDAELKREARIRQAADLRAYVARTVSEIEARERDVESRIAERRPYRPEEARLFMIFITGTGLSQAGDTDHSVRTMPLLKAALDAKVLDPNIVVKDPLRADLEPEPLFLDVYRRIRRTPDEPVLVRAWNVLLLLAASGADLSTPGAEAFAADLRKTATPAFKGLYFELK